MKEKYKINSTPELAKIIRQKRKALNLTQMELATVSMTGVRFISDLESGKKTCQIEKVIQVINMLGLKLEISE